VTAIIGDVELCMFEVISLVGNQLTIVTRYGLAVGEVVALEVEGRGRVTGRVTSRTRDGDRELTELTLLASP
jgi:hypothetical protein